MNYIQDYLYQIIATAIALVVFIALRYLVNSIINKFGKKAEFVESRTHLVKKYIDYLCAGCSYHCLYLGNKNRTAIPFCYFDTYRNRGGVFCPMVDFEQYYSGDYRVFLFSD